jgi:hypothetical protein
LFLAKRPDLASLKLEQQVASLKLLQSEVESREEAFRKEVNAELTKMKKQWTEATTENGDLIVRNQTLTNDNDKLEGKLTDLQAKLADLEGKTIVLSKENEEKIRHELTLK